MPATFDFNPFPDGQDLAAAGDPDLQPHPSSNDLARMVAQLKGHGWVSARHIARAGGWKADLRELRAVASASNGRILSGQKGYVLIEEASEEDVMHCIGRLEHQAGQMLKRADDIRQAWGSR